ncbi:MAG: glutamyl-tRNA reductase [Pseudomonadota bacterium]|nr:glutamyl-tRNA reductase [Pseudomonadota bacterium]
MSIPYVFGLNYATSGFEMREKLAFSRHEIPGVLERLQSSGITREIIILSTCNRTEIYCTTHDVDFVINAICDIQNVCPRTVKKHSYIYFGEQCANHLFRVVSGLESMVLGETEIVAQVKDALFLATEKNSVGTQLSSVFQMALAVEKDVRNVTSINNIAISIGHALQYIVAVNFNKLIDEQILFIGAGDMMQQAAPHFRDVQFAKKTIANRTLSKAENIALKINANAVGIEDLNKIINDYSIIIACSGLDRHGLYRQILNEQILAKTIANKNKKLLIIDLSMPLISDLSLRKYSNIMLLTIDDIAKVVDVGVEKRKIAAIAANNIINDKLIEYQSWLKKRELTPVIRALRDNAESIRREALLNAQKQLAGGESPESVLHELSIKLTNRLIHNPTVNLCSSTHKTQEKLTELITYLYNLEINETKL